MDGGEIIRDSSGKPTGIFALILCLWFLHFTYTLGIFVDNAMSLVSLPRRSRKETLQYYDRTIRDALAVGLTSIHDASTDPDAVEFYKE